MLAKKANQGTTPSPVVEDLDYQKDIHTPTMEDIASEMEEPVTSKEAEKKEEEVKTSEPATEVVSRQTPQEPKEKEQKLELDTDKLTDSIAKKLIDKIAPDEATPQEKKDLRSKLKDLEDKAKAQGREITYPDALEFLQKETETNLEEILTDKVSQNVLEKLNKEVQDEEAKDKQNRETAETQQKEYYQSISSQWDEQTASLRESGKLSTPESKDPKDPANVEYLDFLNQMRAFNIARKEAGKPEILNMVEFHTIHYKKDSEQAGRNAPVYGAKRSVADGDSDDYTSSYIHNTSLDDILAGR